MKADNGIFLNILSGNRQYILPVFQRHYTWDKEHCEQLWNDIKNVQEHKKANYFIGSIVNKAEGVTPISVKHFILIDGQQRLTTVMLILIALMKYATKNPDYDGLSFSADEINNLWLKNPFAKGQEKYKILLAGENRESLIDLIENKPIPEETHSKVFENYKFFAEKIFNLEMKPSDVYEALRKLTVVNITLDDNDDPQAIFESLNSTGKDLSKSDLIRNFVLMNLDYESQSAIYEKYWLPMEKLFGHEKQDILMDDFFRDYLSMKLSRLVNKDEVYEEFKKWFHFKSGFEKNVHALSQDIFNHAKYYTDIRFARSSRPELKSLYSEIRELTTVAYPFLMKVHDDFHNGLITEENLVEILKLTVSYVFRRFICSISAGLNKVFLTLYSEINPADYMNSLKVRWLSLERTNRFPDDKEFWEEFISKDIYHMDTRRYYILDRLENFGGKETVKTIDLTIEHIMPQTLSQEWQKELGENWRETHRKYLHTIGNLTLTGYNSEMGNEPFTEKKKKFIESGLNLNAYIHKQTHWTEKEIRERSNILTKRALQIWAYPNVNMPPKIEVKEAVYNLETYKPSELSRKLFATLDRRIKNLSDDVVSFFKKHYAAYKINGTNFVYVVLQKQKLKIYINMKFKEIIDPIGICRDVTNTGHWGNGDIEVSFKQESDVDDVMEIVMQSFNKANND